MHKIAHQVGLAVAAAAVSFVAVVASAADEATREQAAICEEADKRYQELFGRAATDEAAVVITMYKYTFCPPHRTVKQGAVVRWVNVDRRTTHSVWFKDTGQPESERLFPGEHVEMKVDLAAGRHAYLCGPHWERENMLGGLTIVP